MVEKILGKKLWDLVHKLRSGFCFFGMRGTVEGFGAREEGDQKVPGPQDTGTAGEGKRLWGRGAS